MFWSAHIRSIQISEVHTFAHTKVCALQIAGSQIGALHKVHAFGLQGHLKCIHL